MRSPMSSVSAQSESETFVLIPERSVPCPLADYVFDEGTGNQEVFDRMAKHIVHACMQGFNGTIFAYGQTSSGGYLCYIYTPWCS